MAIIGDASLWADTFPEGFIPGILDLITAAWDSFERPSQEELEVPITRRFRLALIKAKELRQLPLRIDREIVEDDPDTGTEKGRIDLRFTAAGCANESTYFAIECKRLHYATNGRFFPLTGLYVTEGMMRFVQSQYSCSQQHGGMIGYVLDGNADLAIKRIDRFVRKRQKQLALVGLSGFRASTLRPTNSNIRETSHLLERGLFMIHHILLPC